MNDNKEEQLENAVLDFLNRKQDTFAWKIEVTGIYSVTKKTFMKRSRYAIKGLPDVFGFRNKTFFMLELKTGTSVSKEQRAFIMKARKHNQWIDVCKNIEQVAHLLRRIDNDDRLGEWNYEPGTAEGIRQSSGTKKRGMVCV